MVSFVLFRIYLSSDFLHHLDVTLTGNQGGYNYHQSSAGQYNNANNYNYQFGSNSLDSYNNFGTRNTYSGPSPTYGPAFH